MITNLRKMEINYIFMNIKICYRMTKFLFSIIFCFFSISIYSQSYIGWITKQVNFRTGPGADFKIISQLNPGDQLFIISTETKSEFYNVIDISTDKEGYVHKSFIKLGDKVELNEGEVFIPTGTLTNEKPQINVHNSTSITMTLKINSDIYSFAPDEKKIITLNPGKCNYRASAPGVIPYSGYQSIESNMGYEWVFYIEMK